MWNISGNEMPACTDNTSTPDHILNLFTQTRIRFHAYPIFPSSVCVDNNTWKCKSGKNGGKRQSSSLFHSRILLSAQSIGYKQGRQGKGLSVESLSINNHTRLTYNLANHKVVYLNHMGIQGTVCVPASS